MIKHKYVNQVVVFHCQIAQQLKVTLEVVIRAHRNE